MQEISAPNQVSLAPEGYVEVQLVGEQTFATIEAVGKACRPFIDKLNYQHRPILGLIDLTEHNSVNPGTNKAALSLLESIPYKRAAMFGANMIMTEIARGLIAALGKSANTKIFGTREEAVAWLVMRDPLEG
jgi:hypothetical protein